MESIFFKKNKRFKNLRKFLKNSMFFALNSLNLKDLEEIWSINLQNSIMVILIERLFEKIFIKFLVTYPPLWAKNPILWKSKTS